MRVFMTLAADGMTPIGFYPDDVHPEPPAGAVEITDEQWTDAVSHQGARRWNAATSTFEAYVLPLGPPPIRTATGKQLRYALNDLGLRSAWDATVAKANQGTQDYWSCCGSDAVPESNAKIVKLCAAVGTTAAALFDRAVDE